MKKEWNKELIQTYNKEKKKEGFTEQKYSTFFDGRVLQICFLSKGCRYNKNGGCVICDYGKVRRENLKVADIKEIMSKVFSDLEILPNVLLLNSLGSVLDTDEMPIENIVTLLYLLADIEIKTIIFETHYLTINVSILNLIQQKLPNKSIAIELGLESSNKQIREKYLNKYIDEKGFMEKVKLIKSFGFTVEANVIFGAPFLTREQQKRDTIESIVWSFQNNIDIVNLFPINVKPDTVLYKLYERGGYFPVSHEDFINVLQQIPKKYIGKVHLCWYGNREIDYGEKKTILPICEPEEYPKLMEFYQMFNSNKNPDNRIRLLSGMMDRVDER